MQKNLQLKNKLVFDSPAASWNEAAPLGNGFLGAMVFGRTGKELICMNEDSLWSGAPVERMNPDSQAHLKEIRQLLRDGKVSAAQRMTEQYFFSTTPHGRHYEPLGQVWIQEENDKLQKYQRILDIQNAVGTVESCDSRGNEKREFFVSNPDHVMVYRIRREDKGTLNMQLYLTRRDIGPGRSISYVDKISCRDNVITLEGYNGNTEEGIRYAMAATVRTDGVLRRCGSKLVVEDATEAVIYVAGRTSFRSEDPEKWCRQIVMEASDVAYEILKQRHTEDYCRYYDRIHLRLERKQAEEGQEILTVSKRLKRLRDGGEDTKLYELYFNYGRYLLISSSRPGSLPANLQGIWSSEFNPPWGSRYTININIQMNYWIAEKAGLSELHMPLMELQRRMQERGRQTASGLYGARGMCAHHNTDIWGDCAPADFYIPGTVWPMGAAWLALHIWEHYQYTEDQKFLEEYFGILRDNVLFFLDYMYLDKNGNYVTGPSVSPENTYITEKGDRACVCEGPSMDIQIIRELFQDYINACDVLGRTDYLPEVQEHLKYLPPIQIGKHGQIMEWQEDYDEKEPGHRHISQLFGLYPGSQIRSDHTPELASAALRTIKRRLENGGGHTGWSCAWIIHFYARLRRADEAYAMCRKLMTDSTLDNLLDNHPPFQIDGNFGGANGILEMLVQDYGEEVYLLPALPAQWENGRLDGLRLKCGALLCLEWTKGRPAFISIEAVRDIDLTVRFGKKHIHIEKKAGETAVIMKQQRGE